MLKSTTRLLLIGFIFAVLFLGVSRVLALSADGEIHHVARWLLNELRRSDALQQRAAEQAESMNVKKDVTEEYIAGKLTLREAAKQFRAADVIVQSRSEGMVAAYVSPETEQGYCQQVEVWIDMTLLNGHAAKQTEEVRCRLQQEMNELFLTDHLVD